MKIEQHADAPQTMSYARALVAASIAVRSAGAHTRVQGVHWGGQPVTWLAAATAVLRSPARETAGSLA